MSMRPPTLFLRVSKAILTAQLAKVRKARKQEVGAGMMISFPVFLHSLLHFLNGVRWEQKKSHMMLQTRG